MIEEATNIEASGGGAEEPANAQAGDGAAEEVASRYWYLTSKLVDSCQGHEAVQVIQYLTWG